MRAGGFAVPEDEQHRSGSDRRPDVDHAIGHPTRREILRTLLDAPSPMTVPELDELVPSANVSTLNYHVSVLERKQCLRRAGEVVLSNGVLPAYTATIADEAHVIEILESSREEDERR